jgi:hypothetical protein
MKLNKGDRFIVNENGLTGKVDYVSTASDHIWVTWDSFPDKGPIPYAMSDAFAIWTKIDEHGNEIGVDYAPADTNDKLPKSSTWNPFYGYMPPEEEKKGCDHKWVEVGFTHTKIVCYHCDMEKP